MAVPIKKGSVDVVLTYRTPGLKAGMIISAFCFAVYMIACIIIRKKKA
jgi:uncharacterized membrane protein YfhO